MFLEKDGIRVEMFTPGDIARFKSYGYVEVKEAEAVKEAPEQSGGEVTDTANSKKAVKK